MLDFARPIKFDLAPADLNALCEDAARAAGADAPAIADPAGPRLDSLPHVVTDAERLRLVLVNILTNARHAVAARPGAAERRDADPAADAGAQARPRSRSRSAIGARALQREDLAASSIPTSPPGGPAPASASRSPGTSSKVSAARISVASREGDGHGGPDNSKLTEC